MQKPGLQLHYPLHSLIKCMPINKLKLQNEKAYYIFSFKRQISISITVYNNEIHTVIEHFNI